MGDAGRLFLQNIDETVIFLKGDKVLYMNLHKCMLTPKSYF